MEKVIFNTLNAGNRDRKIRFIPEDSQTQPNQSMSIKELLEKHKRGLLRPAPQEFYDDTTDYNSLHKLDLEEKRQLQQQIAGEIETVAEQQKQKKQAADEKRRQAEIEAAAKKLLEEGTNGNQPPA